MTSVLATVRETFEQREQETLQSFAAFSSKTIGRRVSETSCLLRTEFQRDRDRILHSKAFRRLKHKTQVFISPVSDHFRTRLTHSLEVSQVSRTIARALQLNEDLVESIALGHDVGHPPFGHTGEKMLDALSPEGFHHQRQGIRVVTVLENLNLTHEVLDGLKGGPNYETLEAHVVDTADRMAYLHHDVEDALRAGLIRENELPDDLIRVLGGNRHDRLQRMVLDMVGESLKTFESDTPRICMSDEVREAMMALRQWMFEHVYLVEDGEIAQTDKVRRVIGDLYDHLSAKPQLITSGIPEGDPNVSVDRRVVDYISGMTDRYAIDLYKSVLLPNPYQQRLADRA